MASFLQEQTTLATASQASSTTASDELVWLVTTLVRPAMVQERKTAALVKAHQLR